MRNGTEGDAHFDAKDGKPLASAMNERVDDKIQRREKDRSRWTANLKISHLKEMCALFYIFQVIGVEEVATVFVRSEWTRAEKDQVTKNLSPGYCNRVELLLLFIVSMLLHIK